MSYPTIEEMVLETLRVCRDTEDPNHTRTLVTSLMENNGEDSSSFRNILLREMLVTILHGTEDRDVGTPTSSFDRLPVPRSASTESANRKKDLKVSILGTIPMPKVVEDFTDGVLSRDSGSDIPSHSSSGSSADEPRDNDPLTEEMWKKTLSVQPDEHAEVRSSASQEESGKQYFTHKDLFTALMSDARDDAPEDWVDAVDRLEFPNETKTSTAPKPPSDQHNAYDSRDDDEEGDVEEDGILQEEIFIAVTQFVATIEQRTQVDDAQNTSATSSERAPAPRFSPELAAELADYVERLLQVQKKHRTVCLLHLQHVLQRLHTRVLNEDFVTVATHALQQVVMTNFDSETKEWLCDVDDFDAEEEEVEEGSDDDEAEDEEEFAVTADTYLKTPQKALHSSTNSALKKTPQRTPQRTPLSAKEEKDAAWNMTRSPMDALFRRGYGGLGQSALGDVIDLLEGGDSDGMDEEENADEEEEESVAEGRITAETEIYEEEEEEDEDIIRLEDLPASITYGLPSEPLQNIHSVQRQVRDTALHNLHARAAAYLAPDKDEEVADFGGDSDFAHQQHQQSFTHQDVTIDDSLLSQPLPHVPLHQNRDFNLSTSIDLFSPNALRTNHSHNNSDHHVSSKNANHKKATKLMMMSVTATSHKKSVAANNKATSSSTSSGTKAKATSDTAPSSASVDKKKNISKQTSTSKKTKKKTSGASVRGSFDQRNDEEDEEVTASILRTSASEKEHVDILAADKDELLGSDILPPPPSTSDAQLQHSQQQQQQLLSTGPTKNPSLNAMILQSFRSHVQQYAQTQQKKHSTSATNTGGSAKEVLRERSASARYDYCDEATQATSVDSDYVVIERQQRQQKSPPKPINIVNSNNATNNASDTNNSGSNINRRSSSSPLKARLPSTTSLATSATAATTAKNASSSAVHASSGVARRASSTGKARPSSTGRSLSNNSTGNNNSSARIVSIPTVASSARSSRDIAANAAASADATAASAANNHVNGTVSPAALSRPTSAASLTTLARLAQPKKTHPSVAARKSLDGALPSTAAIAATNHGTVSSSSSSRPSSVSRRLSQQNRTTSTPSTTAAPSSVAASVSAWAAAADINEKTAASAGASASKKKMKKQGAKSAVSAVPVL